MQINLIPKLSVGRAYPSDPRQQTPRQRDGEPYSGAIDRLRDDGQIAEAGAMHVVVGLVLAVAGLAIAVLPARLVRYEEQQYSVIVGVKVGRNLTRALLLIVGAALVVAGAILALR